MIPQSDSEHTPEKSAGPSARAPQAPGGTIGPKAVLVPRHNDHERPPGACPTCGRAYDDAHILAPFDPDLSAALDSLTSAVAAISHAKAVLEEVAL